MELRTVELELEFAELELEELELWLDKLELELDELGEAELELWFDELDELGFVELELELDELELDCTMTSNVQGTETSVATCAHAAGTPGSVR